MERLAMCRICLSEKVELKCIANTKLQEVYQKLTCLPLKTEDHRPLKACEMCIALLRKAYKLMIVCLEAEQWYTNVFQGMSCLKHEGCMNLSVVTIPTMEIGCYVKLYDIAKKKKIDEHHQPTTEDTNCMKVDPEITNGTLDKPIDWNESKLNVNEDMISETSESPLIYWSENKLDEAEINYEYSKEDGRMEMERKVAEHTENIDSPIPDKINLKYGGLIDSCVSEQEDEMSHPNTPKLPTKKKANTKNKKKKIVLSNKSVSSKQEEFECKQCSKVFPAKAALRRHAFVHNKKVIRVCHVCGKSFTNSQTFYNHVRSHSSPHQCQKCPKAFPDRYQLKKHMATHGVRRREFICDHCNTSYGSKSVLREHIISKHHISSGPFLCEICDKIFPNKRSLNMHLVVHITRKMYQCDICAKEFNWKSTLKEHNMVVHESICPKPFICAVCNRAFRYKSSVKTHILRQCGELKQKCEVCGETFVQLKHLKQHKREAHSIGLHKCDVCKKQMSSRASLKQHLTIHTGERPHKCHYCHQAFKLGSGLKRHVMTHTGERPHKCPFCHWAFTVSDSLKRHVSTHTGERPYKCKLCPKAFAQNSTLRSHMRTHNANKK